METIMTALGMLLLIVFFPLQLSLSLDIHRWHCTQEFPFTIPNSKQVFSSIINRIRLLPHKLFLSTTHGGCHHASPSVRGGTEAVWVLPAFQYILYILGTKPPRRWPGEPLALKQKRLKANEIWTTVVHSMIANANCP